MVDGWVVDDCVVDDCVVDDCVVDDCVVDGSVVDSVVDSVVVVLASSKTHKSSLLQLYPPSSLEMQWQGSAAQNRA